MSDGDGTDNVPSTHVEDTESVDREQLGSVNNDPRVFALAWLKLQAGLLATDVEQGVVVLGREGQGAFAPVAIWPQGKLGTPLLTAAVEAAIRSRSTVVESTKKHPVIACPLLVNGKLTGAAAFELGNSAREQLPSLARQLEWGMAWLQVLVHRNRYTSADRLTTVLNLVATALHYPRFQAAATATTTELAGILQCERVSIGFQHSRHLRLAAMSHSASFSRKANIVRCIEAAMDEAVDQQATVLYPVADDSALQITRAQSALASQSGAGAVCTVPFAEGERLIGALTLERPTGQRFDSATVQLCEHAAALLGPVLDVKRRDDRWLISKAVDSLREHARRLVGPRHTAFKLATFGLLCLVLFLALARGDYRVTADARLEGVVQRAIAAPLSGFIAETRARAGDVVHKDELLFTLDDSDLRLERLKWSSQKSQYSREHSEALADHDRAKANILAAQIDQAAAQLALVEEQLRRIRVTAPFDSYVVSGDLSQSLGAPVERGDILFEVAPLDDYRVILDVDERDIGDLAPGQTGHLALSGIPDAALPIKVTRITPVSTVTEGRNYFRIEAAITDMAGTELRPGMQGVGKVDIDRRRLAWIWSHKITQWWRMFLWTWWP